MRWYMSRSNILTNKSEIKKIANKVRNSGNFKKVRIVKRTFPKNKVTKTPKQKGYWLKVER